MSTAYILGGAAIGASCIILLAIIAGHAIRDDDDFTGGEV